jgi:hypothetical protein
MGQKQTLTLRSADVRFTSKADIGATQTDVRFVPIADIPSLTGTSVRAMKRYGAGCWEVRSRPGTPSDGLAILVS